MDNEFGVVKSRQLAENPPVTSVFKVVESKLMKKPIIPRVLLAAGMEKTDVFYATGLDTPDPFVLVKAGARLHLVVSALEASRAKRVCPKAILHTPGELFAGEPG